MTFPTFSTLLLNQLMARIRAGDVSAKNELYQATCQRLERLTRKMLSKYPEVKRWEETNDVLQNGLLRFNRSLEKMEFNSTRQYFALAAEHMRRELIDLWRHYYGPRGLGANHDSVAGKSGDQDSSPILEPAFLDPSQEDLEDWTRFHEAVEKLPELEREIVSLTYYHKWNQADIAELLQISVRSVQRYWRTAMVQLHSQLKSPVD